MKYYTEITGWGKDSLFFLEDPDALFLILFNDDAPEELAEISVLHRKSCVLQRITAGDTLIIAEKAFDITAIGEEVQHTLQQLGRAVRPDPGGLATMTRWFAALVGTLVQAAPGGDMLPLAAE